MTGTGFAIVISAALFGLAHAANPGASVSAIAALSMGMGVLLAVAYLLTRSVWFAVGIHAGWNLAEGYIFGLLNSGVRDPHYLLQTTLIGSDLVTGGAFGPEGSIVLLVISLALSGALLRLAVGRRRWKSRRGRPVEG